MAQAPLSSVPARPLSARRLPVSSDLPHATQPRCPLEGGSPNSAQRVDKLLEKRINTLQAWVTIVSLSK
jgi:hypothetical protein